MYIWIFLATIMVALSFFNLSVRRDRDNAFSEIKAANVVNRFKAEHNAAARTMECEVALKLNNQNWRQTGSYSAITLTDDILNGIGYTSMQSNLPIGYQSKETFEVNHAIFCLSKRIDMADNSFVNCNSSNFIYVVSFSKIPENWLTKNSAEGEKPTPLPAFKNLLAKGTSLRNPYGWTECSKSEEGTVSCLMFGVGAKNVMYDEENDKTLIAMLPYESLVWQYADFADDNACAGTPCLFSYQLMRKVDLDDHCQRLVDAHAAH